MGLEFVKMKRSEIKEAAALATRSFFDYCYFTNYLPDEQERQSIMYSIIYHEYKTNFGKAEYLVAKQDGKMVAVAQLNSHKYRKPSDLAYAINGWLNVYKSGDKKRIDDWLAMDAAAGQPCHDYQKTHENVWYASSLTVDPEYQGTGIGSKFLEYWLGYAKERGGKEMVFFTNSESNIAYYKKRGWEEFDYREFEHEGIKMGSWSVRKKLV